MEKIDRNLIIVDMCSRIPYGTKVCYEHPKTYKDAIKELTYYTDISELVIRYHGRCYLRPMSSMTKEEEKELKTIHHQFYKDKYIDAGIFAADDCGCTVWEMAKILDYLSQHHFDYRGLIEKGLALEALKGIYKVEE